MRYIIGRPTADRSPVLEAFEIGPTQSETPEGYLYCRDVPIARIGVQQYLNSELEPDAEGGPDGVIHVERRAEDVFHPDTIASFEGKDVTDDHPEEMLHPGIVKQHSVGTVLNVRRGDVGMTDFLIADLLIKDKHAIAAVRAGKRQVSCGYGSDYESLAPGRARQHRIIGNHVALVGRGRCGPSCAIGDEDMVQKEKEKKGGLMGRFLAFLDAEGTPYKEGEEGALTLNDESLPSKSGTESHSMGSGTEVHIHVGGGPSGATTIAPTTDKKAKDKKMADKKSKDAKKAKDDEGTAKEMETEDADPDEDDKKEVMDAMSKAFDAAMKAIRDRKMKDKKSKDADGDEDDDSDTMDNKVDVEEEGDDESEGSVASKDAEGDDDDDDDDKKTPAKDKKSKDKKSTKDSAPMKDEFKKLVSDAEILAPGLKLPTFDAAVAQRSTIDAMCIHRRRALAIRARTEDGAEDLATIGGGTAVDLKTLTCDSAKIVFDAAVAFASDRNTDPGKLRKAKITKDAKGPPSSAAEFNARASEFYKSKIPTKSA